MEQDTDPPGLDTQALARLDRRLTHGQRSSIVSSNVWDMVVLSDSKGPAWHQAAVTGAALLCCQDGEEPLSGLCKWVCILKGLCHSFRAASQSHNTYVVVTWSMPSRTICQW